MSDNQLSGSAPEPMEYLRVDPATGDLKSAQPAKSDKPQIQKPTAPNPAPPEVVNKEGKALAVVTSPDVCKSPKVPIPYMTWGMGEDDLNYAPNVRANGRIIKLQTSKFSCCYGDEPGVGKGVKSRTVGDVVEPVTSSTIVRANGHWVQRHTDTCTLNRGNAPGEYIYVKSTDTHKAPDGADAQDKTQNDKTRNEKIADYARSKGWTPGAGGGWNTSGGGWASNGKVGEEMDYVNSGRGNVQPLSLGSGPSEIKAYTPSWTERLEGSVQDGLMSLGMDKYQAGEYGRKVGTVAGFVPGLGNSLSANDAKRSFDAGQYLLSGVQTIGAVIGIGPGKPLAKGLEKGAEKLVQTEAEQAAARALEEKAAKEAAEAAAKKEADAANEVGENGARITARKAKTPHITRDELGRIIEWKDSVHPDDIGTGTPTNQAARDHARSLGKSTDDAGHARGSNLGGSGTDTDNIFPQAPSVNRGQFRVFEQNVADRITKTGRSADIKLTPVYEGISTRPSSITYNVRFDDGTSVEKNFPNP